MALTIYSYVRFRKLRYWYVSYCTSIHPYIYSFHYREFSVEWWSWLIATGFFMACTWGSKVNGILTVITIGIAVLIDLWGILDYRKGYTMVSSPVSSVTILQTEFSRIISGSILRLEQSA